MKILPWINPFSDIFRQVVIQIVLMMGAVLGTAHIPAHIPAQPLILKRAAIPSNRIFNLVKFSHDGIGVVH